MSHLSAIGFAMGLEAFQGIVVQAAQEGTSHTSPKGYYVQWAPGAGVELWVQINKPRNIVGCNPHFAGDGRMPVSVIETFNPSERPLDGSCFGWAAPRDENNPYSGLHAVAASLPDFDFVDERILTPPVVTLQIAAFALEMETFPTESAFLESDFARQNDAKPDQFVWNQEEPGADRQTRAHLSGLVLQSERRENPITQQAFNALVLRTEAGTIDVVAGHDLFPRRPVAGTMLAGNFWLSARVMSELPPPKKPATFERARRTQ